MSTTVHSVCILVLSDFFVMPILAKMSTALKWISMTYNSIYQQKVHYAIFVHW